VRGTKAVAGAIAEVEGFDVRFVADAGESDRRRVDEYPFVKAANKAWTVAKWRATRFEPFYEGFSVVVLNGDGAAVHGKTLLATVRDSYFEYEYDSYEDEIDVDSRDASVSPGLGSEVVVASPGAMATLPSRQGVSLPELEGRLLAAANSLRGPVDPADFKSYVFPLLFFKWIDDTWTWEHAQAVADFGETITVEEEADYHRFDIPTGCHWADVRNTTTNVGVKLRNTLDALELANPHKLAGIFGDVAWGNKERLPEPSLLNLIDTFDRLTLNPEAVPNDLLGAAYEYLLRQFADESGKKAGEFFTPRAVVRLLVKLLDPQAGETIYDPACGSGGMLVETIGEVRDRGGDVRTLRLYGQEVNLTTSAIARMNLYLHDIEDFQVLRGDTLRDPKFREKQGELSQFDVVIANPPFSLKNWGAELWVTDTRAFCGVPPKNSADLAWVQHMVASMDAAHGRVGVVMPHGVLFRGGAEGTIRQCLVQSDRLDAVIGLPPNLFYSTTIPACLLVFRAAKPAERLGRVLFVDGSQRFAKGKNQNLMTDHDIAAVVNAHDAGGDAGGVRVRLVDLAEIKERGWDLSFANYLAGAQQEGVDVPTALADLAGAQAALREAEQFVAERLKAAGYG
jgi:type I restriction enzyme M protein